MRHWPASSRPKASDVIRITKSVIDHHLCSKAEYMSCILDVEEKLP